MSGAPRVGIDLGGTKIAGAAFSADGAALAEARADTPRAFDDIVAALAGVAEALFVGAGERAERLGVCMPGLIARDGTIVNCVNLPSLVGRPLAEALGDRLGLAVALANDANCFALSEARGGAACDAKAVFGIVLGTGVGAGLVLDGRIVAGANALAGEWGHIRFPFDPAVDPAPIACACGRMGCVETLLRARAVADEYVRLGGTGAASTPEVVARADRDPLARRALQAYCDRMARALVDVVHLLDPDVVVVGGGMSRVPALFDLVPPAMARYAIGPIGSTRLLPAAFGADSGARGAAWL